MNGLETRYDPIADSLTVLRQFDAVHTSTAPRHDCYVTVLRDATEAVTGVTLHGASALTPSEWTNLARSQRVPGDLARGVTEWLRVRGEVP